MNRTGRILFAFIALVFISSCVRERDTNTDYNLNQTIGELIYSDVLDIVDDASTKQTGQQLSNYNINSLCASITHNVASKNLIVDFGTTNCLCNDGRNRRGQIIVNYTGTTYSDSLSTATITFNNYFLDEHQVFGTMAITQRGRNVAMQPYMDITTTGKYLKPLILDTLIWNASRERRQIAGSETPVYGDDVFEFVGTNSGWDEYKVYYASNITVPLVKTNTCKYFTSGKLDLQPEGHALRLTDYGNGNCDNDATVTLNNKAFNIKLK